jgi:ornithine cyclodeaminase
LARAEVRYGALFGCGGQAAMQLVALDSARSFERIRVFAPRSERVRAFIHAMQPRVEARIELAASPSEAISQADVVVAATSSSAPVFDGRELAPGCHVTAVGSISRDMREVDSTTVARARLFVDSVAGAQEEAGELIAAIEAGITRPGKLVEIGAVVADPRLGRGSDTELTFYKSVGHAVQDVAIARLVLDRAGELGLGQEIEL